MYTVGGLTAGIEMWELAYIPSLLNNSESWVSMDVKDIFKLDDLQLMMYRTLLRVPASTPKPALVWDMGGTMMKFRIMGKKLIFVKHILSQDETSLAKQVLTIQIEHKIDGLVSEVQEAIKELDLPDTFETDVPKNKWKKLVKKAIMDANEKDLKTRMNDYKKLTDSEMQEESFEVQKYLHELSVNDARTYFAYR